MNLTQIEYLIKSVRTNLWQFDYSLNIDYLLIAKKDMKRLKEWKQKQRELTKTILLKGAA